MRRARGFSLVELLVSIAIIALLIAIVLPAFGRARAQARRAVCACNLHQFLLGFHMYAGEHGGRAMPLAYLGTGGSDPGQQVFWWGTNEVSGVDHTRGFLWPYFGTRLGENSVFECPSQPWGTYRAQGFAHSVTSTYGYNGYFLSPSQTPGWGPVIDMRRWQNLDTLRLPQRLFAFADTMIDQGGAEPANVALLDPPFLYRGPRRWRPNEYPTTSFRHAGRTNAAHADGHVAALDPGDGKITSPRFGIGSVGKRNDPHYIPDWRDW